MRSPFLGRRSFITFIFSKGKDMPMFFASAEEERRGRHC